MENFEILMLHGRPAAGKSETIDFLSKTPLDKRLEQFHVGDFIVRDDFPILWAWFEEDDIRDKLGQPRINSTPEGFFLYPYQWDILIEKLSLEYTKLKAEGAPDTTVIEFARGTQHGGYKRAYEHLSEEILKKCAILYVEVTFEDSMRKNRRRKNTEKHHSILEHSVEDEKMKTLYEFDDFREFTAQDPNYVTVKGHKVPYVIMDNHDDITTVPGPELNKRLQEKMQKLYTLFTSK